MACFNLKSAFLKLSLGLSSFSLPRSHFLRSSMI
ncbi:unnamed protein product [Rhodiola kirilowii]